MLVLSMFVVMTPIVPKSMFGALMMVQSLTIVASTWKVAVFVAAGEASGAIVRAAMAASVGRREAGRVRIENLLAAMGAGSQGSGFST
ncbi:hypothetical protein ACHZ97_07580 [Lysobacter soli]|uniref:hypothetical protein n=1 Tax=Lysobacter soli TaxID=453783 RepID=UPI0037CA7725